MFLCLTGFSQSNIRLDNYWENTYYINPASIYSEYKFMAGVAGRKQWIGFPGAPSTEYFIFTGKINTKENIQVGQLGLKIYNDVVGFTRLINVSTSYSYSVRLNKRLLMNLGVAYKIQNYSYDLTKSHRVISDDPLISLLENNQNTYNSDIGVEFVSNSFLFGAALQNLMSLFSEENPLQSNSNLLYVMHRTNKDYSFYLQSGICAIQNENLYQMEFTLTGFVNPKKHPDLFQLGFFYRTGKEFGVLFGADLGNSLRLACSYDYNISGISHKSFGTPEILLTWKFGKLRDCECRELYK